MNAPSVMPWRLLQFTLLALGLVYVYPFLWILCSSLKAPGEIFNSGLSLVPQHLRFSNFREAWTRADFGLCFFNSAAISAATVALSVLLSSMAGLVLARGKTPGSNAVIGVLALTLFLPRNYSILPLFDLMHGLGLLDSRWCVILLSVSSRLAFNVLLYLAFFKTVPVDIEEAAELDGASFPHIYWSVLLPLARPMTATVALLSLIYSWNDFFTPLVFTLGKPELRTLAVGMYAFAGENSRDWQLICAGAVISIAPVLLVFTFLQRYFIEGIAGAVKE